METLVQKRLLDNREFKIQNSKLTYHDRRIGSRSIDLNIPFEDISNTKVSHTYSEYMILVASGFCFFLSLVSFLSRNEKDASPFIWIILASAGIFGLIYFLIKRENSWKIRLGAGASIYIHKSIPDSQTVNHFIDSLFESRDKYLRQEYMTFDPKLSYDNQYHNLKWLLSSDIISKDEFENKYDELKKLYNSDKTIKGFGG